MVWSTNYGDLCSPVKLLLRYDKSGTPPDPEDPKAGEFLEYLDTDENSTTHGLLHAATTYAYTIYGCEDSLRTNISSLIPTPTPQAPPSAAPGT